MEVTTDNGYNNGEATCQYTTDASKEENYITFLETKASKHKQRQDLISGTYNYFIKCYDLGGNTVYNKTTFTVNVDRQAPIITRVYNEGGQLKIVTNEEAQCSYSSSSCNFEIDNGIKLSTFNSESRQYFTDLNAGKLYYIRCKDLYNNQPSPNACSIIVKPSKFTNSTIIL